MHAAAAAIITIILARVPSAALLACLPACPPCLSPFLHPLALLSIRARSSSQPSVGRATINALSRLFLQPRAGPRFSKQGSLGGLRESQALGSDSSFPQEGVDPRRQGKTWTGRGRQEKHNTARELAGKAAAARREQISRLFSSRSISGSAFPDPNRAWPARREPSAKIDL